MATNGGDYTNAISGYEYVVNKKESLFYFPVRTELLNCRREKSV